MAKVNQIDTRSCDCDMPRVDPTKITTIETGEGYIIIRSFRGQNPSWRRLTVATYNQVMSLEISPEVAKKIRRALKEVTT